MLDFFSTGLSALVWENWVMMGVGIVLIYLGIFKKMEPLLLGPIGFAALLANVARTEMGLTDTGGLMEIIYTQLISTGVIPLIIFLGIGTMTDFSPLLANPKTFFLGAAAQIGIFCALGLAVFMGFGLSEAASIGIIGGADGPTAIYTATRLVEDQPGIIAAVTVSAYSYMALVPIIQPPIIKSLTTKKQRQISMGKLRKVRPIEKILFPISVTIIVGIIVPFALPLVGMLMLGNLFQVSGVMNRLSKSGGNELINVATIFLGLGIGFLMVGDTFLNLQTIKILLLGIFAFATATAGGTLLGQLFYKLSSGKINPMIGAAGVSAVPMASRVVQKIGLKENPRSHLLMHAMGPNVAGVIGSATAAGVLIGLLG